MVFELDDKIWFPHPEMPILDEPSGIVAIGGDLSVARLLLAYDHGFFPWYAFKYKDIQWYCPKQRFVVFPNEIHVSHSMRTLMNKHQYRVTFNTAFDQVIRACSTVDNRINMEGAWLGDDIIEAYTKLHELGRARSVEVWRGNELVGGLYGVTSGSGFVGESMFSLEPNTSKLALIALARQMQEHGGSLIDCQIRTHHLETLGGRYISYEEYIKSLHGSDAYHPWEEMLFLEPAT
ncbi:MAG: leucyl/phenylalanyl-tRNA--protein transferase [Muribaculaceae bacterium]|nr:leucyl/phenylalanyl-tRNA--protein transferase [Muribaculaceae bacterium]